MSSPEAGQLIAGRTITVEDTAVNDVGVLRVKFDGGWVSLSTTAGEVILEPVADEAADQVAAADAGDEQAEDSVLEDLIELYKEKNGKEPTDEEVNRHTHPERSTLHRSQSAPAVFWARWVRSSSGSLRSRKHRRRPPQRRVRPPHHPRWPLAPPSSSRRAPTATRSGSDRRT